MYQQQYPYGQPPAAPELSTAAVLSLIASILGLTVLPTIGSVAGLILGYAAKSAIRSSWGRKTGSGLATAGIWLGWLGILVGMFAICIVILAWLGIFGSFGITLCAGFGQPQ